MSASSQGSPPTKDSHPPLQLARRLETRGRHLSALALARAHDLVVACRFDMRPTKRTAAAKNKPVMHGLVWIAAPRQICTLNPPPAFFISTQSTSPRSKRRLSQASMCQPREKEPASGTPLRVGYHDEMGQTNSHVPHPSVLEGQAGLVPGRAPAYRTLLRNHWH